MVKLLLKCPKCNYYSLNKSLIEVKGEIDSDESYSNCSLCKTKLKTPHPPKFSMDNKYLKYIRELKEQVK